MLVYGGDEKEVHIIAYIIAYYSNMSTSGTPPRPSSTGRSGGDIRRNSEPAPMGVLQLSTRRLRSNSGTHLPNDLNDLSIAEMNSIAPPSPIYKIVLTGGPCGGKTTSLARVSLFLYFFCITFCIPYLSCSVITILERKRIRGNNRPRSIQFISKQWHGI